MSDPVGWLALNSVGRPWPDYDGRALLFETQEEAAAYAKGKSRYPEGLMAAAQPVVRAS